MSYMSVSSILLFTERNQKNIAEATVKQWDRPAKFTCLEKTSYSGSDPLLQHFNILLQLFLNVFKLVAVYWYTSCSHGYKKHPMEPSK